MKKQFIGALAALTIGLFIGCSNPATSGGSSPAAIPNTPWAQTLTAGLNYASFNGVTIDSSGNSYAVGAIYGTGSYGFGNGVNAVGTASSLNTVIVKYNSSGITQWAQTLTAGSSDARFNGVTSDSSGNSYAVGAIYGTGSYGFGNGVSAVGTASRYNTVIVKYNNSGIAQWAKTLTTGSSDAQFNGVTSDSSGNTYAVGYIYGTGSYSFGNGVSAVGTSYSYNTVIVKYNSSGIAQWAQTLTVGSSDTQFYGVTSNSSGNTYAVGTIYGTGSYGFGNGVSAAGASSGYNTVIVKYNSSGLAQWAKTLSAGSSNAVFYGVTIDSSGNTYAVGYINGTSSYGFGNGVSAAGTFTGNNNVIVKYNSSGIAQWAQTQIARSRETRFNSVTIDGSGNTYAVGFIEGTGSYNFGNGVSAAGASSRDNTVIVKYNSNGIAQWAQTLTAGSSNAQFTGVTIDNSGNTYAVGCIMDTGNFSFGNGVNVAGTATNYNSVIVKYLAQ